MCMPSCILLFASPQTVARQAPCPWNFPGKSTGVGCHFLLQGIWVTQDWTCVSCTAGRFFSTAPPGKPHRYAIAAYQTSSIPGGCSDQNSYRAQPEWILELLFCHQKQKRILGHKSMDGLRPSWGCSAVFSVVQCTVLEPHVLNSWSSGMATTLNSRSVRNSWLFLAIQVVTWEVVELKHVL